LLAGAEPVPRARGPFARPSWTSRSADAELREVRADEIVRLAAPGGLWSPWRSWRESLLARCGAIRDPLARGFARAFLLGDGGALGADVSDLFARTGLRHVLAVSGWHVAMLAALVFGPLSRALAWALAAAHAGRRVQRAAPAMLAITLVLLYVPIGGDAAPVRRAGVGLALGLCAGWLPLAEASTGSRWIRPGRRVDPLSLWSAALALECLADARAPTEIGLELSYAATLGLIVASRPLARWLRGLASSSAEGIALPSARGGAVQLARVVRRRCARAAEEGLGASLAAVLATLPIGWQGFGEWSPIGVIATPLFLPVFAWLLVSGSALLALPALWPEAAFSAPARATVILLGVFDHLPGTPVLLPARPWPLIVAATVGVMVWLARGRIDAWLGRASAWTWAAILLPWHAAPRELELVALDVGHGTAVVLRAPNEPCWLFDCGSRDRPRVAQTALAPLLAHWETDELGVVLSHIDRDHSSGLAWVVERCNVRIWAGAVPAPLGERLPHTTPRIDLEAGRIALPTRPGPLTLGLLRGRDEPGNEGSRTLHVRCGGELAILFGDAEEEGLLELLRRDLVGGPFTEILLPHHGSATPWLGRLLEAAQPASVWISSSERPAVAAELDRRGLPWSWTGRDGPLDCASRPSPGPSR
jgi:competence protein ComEC